MKTVVITGASGLVGTAVIAELSQRRGYAVWAVSEKQQANQPNLTWIPRNSLEALMQEKHFDVMLHLAFPRNAKETDWADGFRYNMWVLQLAHRYGIGKLIYVSSQSLYGWQRSGAAREKNPVVITSPYTAGKYCSELAIEAFMQEIPHTCVRLSTIIGPTTKERVPNKFFAQIVQNKELQIQGGGQVFSFLDVRDAAAGLAVLVETNHPLRALYNLGTAQSATLLEIAEMSVQIGRDYGFHSGILITPSDAVLNNRMDVSAMEEDFGWKAQITLEESLRNIFLQNYIERS